MWGENFTQLKLTDSKLRILCSGPPQGNPTNSCGLDDKPAVDQESEPLVLRSAYMDPQGPGATAAGNQWDRSEYTVWGSYYYVMVKVGQCPEIGNKHVLYT